MTIETEDWIGLRMIAIIVVVIISILVAYLIKNRKLIKESKNIKNFLDDFSQMLYVKYDPEQDITPTKVYNPIKEEYDITEIKKRKIVFIKDYYSDLDKFTDIDIEFYGKPIFDFLNYITIIETETESDDIYYQEYQQIQKSYRKYETSITKELITIYKFFKTYKEYLTHVQTQDNYNNNEIVIFDLDITPISKKSGNGSQLYSLSHDDDNYSIKLYDKERTNVLRIDNGKITAYDESRIDLLETVRQTYIRLQKQLTNTLNKYKNHYEQIDTLLTKKEEERYRKETLEQFNRDE